MYKISFLGNEAGFLNTSDLGIRFGYFGHPILFSVHDTDTNQTFALKILVANNPEKPKVHIERPDSISPNLSDVVIQFFNPTVPGISGLSAPYAVKVNQNKSLLGFMFWVDTIQNSQVFRLTYEFYNDRVPSPSPPKVMQ